MRTLGSRIAIIAGIAAGALLAVLLLVFAILNTETGQDRLAALVEPLSGGKISLSGLRGAFPQSLRVGHIQVSDTQGPWLVIDDLSLDWSPLRLLSRRVDVTRLEAGRVAVARLPAPDKEDSGGGGDITVDVHALRVARLETAAALSGKPGVFSLQGNLHYVSADDLAASLAVTRMDVPDTYRIDAVLKDGAVSGTAHVREGTQGLAAGLLGLNAVGAISLDATASGPRTANAVAFTLAAGELRASGKGTIDLPGAQADVDFSAGAPAMALRPDLAWQSLAVSGHVHGPFTAPDIAAHVDIKSLSASGADIGGMIADVTGRNGNADFTASADGVVLPGGVDLFAHAPLALKGHADLAGAARTVDLTLTHPLLAVNARIMMGAAETIDAHVNVPSLAPFAAIGGTDMAGHATLAANAMFEKTGLQIALDGAIAATGGQSPLVRVMGRDAHFTIKTGVAGSDIAISDMRFDGAAVHARMAGTMKSGVLAMDGNVGLSDISLLAAGFSGTLDVTARARGPMATARVDLTAAGNLGGMGFARQRLTLTADATGLPQPSAGNFRTEGGFAGAPVALNGSFTHGAHETRVSVTKGDWKSLSARADVTVAENKSLQGHASLRFANLADLTPVLGMELAGSIDGTIDLATHAGRSVAAVQLTAQNLRSEQGSAGSVTLSGTVGDPLGTPRFALALNAASVAAAGYSAAATAQVNGGMDALALHLTSDLHDAAGNPAMIAAAAQLDAHAKRVLVSAFSGTYHGQTVVLTAPAAVDFSSGIAVDKLMARIGAAQISLAGRVMPVLDATAAVRNLTPQLVSAFVPSVSGEGNFSADARLTGTLAAPEGNITVQGRGLKPPGAPEGLQPASLDAHAQLQGGKADFDMTLAAGSDVRLNLSGNAPLGGAQAMDIKASGKADLAMLSPFLSAEGRAVRGQVALDASITGTMAAPHVEGTANLTGGEIRDYGQGLRVHDIALGIEARDGVVRIANLSGRAGPGTISGTGTLDLMAAGMPVDVALQVKGARPITNDTLTAILDADLKLTGKASERLSLSGTVRVPRGEIDLPDNLPQSVAVLDVRRRGQMAVAAPAKQAVGPTRIDLDLAIRSPGQFFVRGHGLDAEVEGNIHTGGTVSSPVMTGGFTMRRGTLTLAGSTLNFTSGKVSFDGAGVSNRIDPAIDFIAQSVSGGITAQLEISGHSSAPKVTLSSTPDMPQDEVLARLLFQQGMKELSPFQLAEIAEAAASLGGVGTGFNPVASVRRGLGLDLLSVGSQDTGNGTGTETTLEAGKYVAPGVYVGAKQGTAGTSQAQVQVDLTRNLKARATLSAGTSATVTQGASQSSNGSSIGLSYQFEY